MIKILRDLIIRLFGIRKMAQQEATNASGTDFAATQRRLQELRAQRADAVRRFLVAMDQKKVQEAKDKLRDL